MRPVRSAPLPDPIVFAAGDPGGANALRPVILTLAAQGVAVAVLDHGFLSQNLPPEIPRTYELGPCAALCVGTSVADTVPLALARAARQRGIPVTVVLDNWVNYRARLATDGLAPFIPDYYAVMDDKARAEALADGLPSACLVVTGHPNLAALQAEAADFDGAALRQSLGWGLNGRQLIAFVNEPVSADQGTGPHHPGWRGYTEEDALSALAQGLAGAAVDVAVIPHPRDDVPRLRDVWQRVRGSCGGGVVTAAVRGRDVVLAADRVAGMASILLYEAWLLGRPTLSLQPGLVRQDLLSIANRPGIVLMRDHDLAPVRRWLALAGAPPPPDLERHAGAAQRIAHLLAGPDCCP